GDRVLAGRRDSRVDGRLHVDVHEWMRRWAALTRILVGGLHGIDRWGDEDATGTPLPLSFGVVSEGFKLRQFFDRQVDLHDGTFDLDSLYGSAVAGRKLPFIDQGEVGSLRVGIGEHETSGDLLSAGEGDPGGAAVRDGNPLDLGAGADFDTLLPGHGAE